jgi:hypothetical protein
MEEGADAFFEKAMAMPALIAFCLGVRGAAV